MNDSHSGSLPPDHSIQGVIFKALKTHRDERGFFREIIRSSDDLFEDGRFAQWSHSRMIKDVVKAWHYHHLQTDWWYVPSGQIEAVLFDNRPESPTYQRKLAFLMGDSVQFGANTHETCVRIPPGVLHGLKVLSDEAHLFYIVSEWYNPKDEGRFPYNDPLVPHNWGNNALTVENDRRRYEPENKRVILS